MVKSYVQRVQGEGMENSEMWTILDADEDFTYLFFALFQKCRHWAGPLESNDGD